MSLYVPLVLYSSSFPGGADKRSVRRPALWQLSRALPRIHSPRVEVSLTYMLHGNYYLKPWNSPERGMYLVHTNKGVSSHQRLSVNNNMPEFNKLSVVLLNKNCNMTFTIIIYMYSLTKPKGKKKSYYWGTTSTLIWATIVTLRY